MTTLQVFDKPMCCSTGICGPKVDPVLPKFASDLAWLKDQGRSYTTESAMAKLHASEVAKQVTNDALQIHGGYGYITEYHVERYLRDAKLTEIGEGTSEIQRMVIARNLLGIRAM